MKTYLLCAAGAVFLSVIVTSLMPEGKLNKTVAFALRLICIFLLIQPLTELTVFGAGESGTFSVDYDYIAEAYATHQGEQLAQLLAERFSAECGCTVCIVYGEGQFTVTGVIVAVKSGDENLIEQIYEYLEQSGYINITVYATGN